MADVSTEDGNGMEAAQRRPLWLAGLAGLLTATFLAWIAVLSLVAYDNARLDEAHMFEGDGNIRPPDPFTSDWWADAMLFLPRIALVALAYALPLMAIMAFFERHPNRSRLGWALAGALATGPLACFWVFLAASSHFIAPASVFIGPIVALAVIGTIGGAVSGAVRRGRRG